MKARGARYAETPRSSALANHISRIANLLAIRECHNMCQKSRHPVDSYVTIGALMFCTNCGARIDGGARFCTNCGAAIEAEPAPQPSTNAAIQEKPQQIENASVVVPSSSPETQKSEKRSSKRKGRSSRKNTVIVVAVLLVAIIALGSVAFLTKGFGLLGVVTRDTVNDYSWSELSRISNEISRCSDESSAIELARQYNLVNEDGTLDGTQSKSFTLTDGTPAEAVIAGFNHDSKTSGSKAGITFMFKNCISTHAINSNGEATGGWEQSEMRAYLNEELIERLPADLQECIVAVDKQTNNVGITDDPDSVTVTSDRLWLYSLVELSGELTPEQYKGSTKAPKIYNREGTQYQLFSDTDIDVTDSNVLLVKSVSNAGGETESSGQWWLRTIYHSNGKIIGVSGNGYPIAGGPSNQMKGVAPGFCI